MRAIGLGVILVALGAVSACFDPPQPDVTFLCGAEGECPADYECRADNCCHKIGSTSDDTCVAVDAGPEPDAPVIDAGPIEDAPPTPDASLDFDATADLDAAPDFDASPVPVLTGLTASAIVTAGDNVDLMVTIDQAAPAGGSDVLLASSMMAVATVPAMVTVAQGATTAMFTVSGVSGGSSTITATLGVSLMSDVTVAAAVGSVGDLVINEFLALSSTGNVGEFVELVNTGTVTLDMSGWNVSANAAMNAMVAPSLVGADPIYVAPGEIVYGVPNPALAQDIPGDADFVYGPAGAALELADAGADLRIHDGVADLDIVDFTGWLTNTGTPAPNQFVGITDLSTQLDSAQQSFSSNDSGARWCVPSAPTPGANNGSCTTPLAINEVMVNAFGSDDDNEFVELRGVPGAHLENVRLRSTDADGVPTGIDVSFVFGTRVPLDALFVLADNTGGTTAVLNADLEAIFGDLPDGPGALQVIVGAGVNDAVGYGTLNVAVDTVDGFAIVETASTSFAEGSSIARDTAGTDNDDNASDFHLDPSPTPGVENDVVAVTITSVSPDDGLATAAAATTITGDDFVVGAVVLVNGVLAACTVTSATNINCSFPSNGGTVELVDVSVTNPSVGSQSLADAFTYTGVLSDPGAAFFCNVQFPASTTTTVGVATEDIFGQIYIMGMTDTQGTPVAGIDCDLGYGPDGSDVTLVNFTWAAAAPHGLYDFGQNNDEHVSTLTVGATGTYDYAYRFSTDGGFNYYYCDTGAGSDDGYSAAAAGDLTVN